MSLIEICISLVVALLGVVGALCAYIFNQVINSIKEDMNGALKKINESVDKVTSQSKNDITTLWTKYDDVKELIGSHQLSDETRFGRIDAMLGIKDQQYSEIIGKIDTLTNLLKDVISGRTQK